MISINETFEMLKLHAPELRAALIKKANTGQISRLAANRRYNQYLHAVTLVGELSKQPQQGLFALKTDLFSADQLAKNKRFMEGKAAIDAKLKAKKRLQKSNQSHNPHMGARTAPQGKRPRVQPSAYVKVIR